MPTKDQAASGGLRRGFLLSTPKNKTKKKQHRMPPPEVREIRRSEENTELSTGSLDDRDKKTEQPLPSQPSGRPVTSSALLDLEDSPSATTINTPSKHTKSLLHIFDAKKEKQNSKSNQPTSGLLDIRETSNFVDVDSKNGTIHGTMLGASEGSDLIEISSSTMRRKKGSLISDAFQNDTHKSSSALFVAPRGIADHSEGDAAQVSKHHQSLDNNYKDNISNSSQVASESAHGVSGLFSTPVENSVTVTNNAESQEFVQKTTNFLQCQQELDRTLWKLRRKRRRKGSSQRKGDNSDEEWRGTCTEFCKRLFMFRGSDSQSQSQQDDETAGSNTDSSQELQFLSWLWDSLLMACPKKSSQCLAEMRLGLVLLEWTRTAIEWKAFSNILRPGDVNDKRRRVCALGATTVLDFWCTFRHKQQQQQNDAGEHTIPIDPTWLLDFVNNTLPLLGQQLAGQPTRTILGQRCMDGIYSIVATIVEHYFGLENSPQEDGEMLKQALWKVSEDSLVRAWDTQVLWNTQIVATNSRGDGKVDQCQITPDRKTCTTSLVHSWKEIFKRLSSREDKAQASQQWCQLLRGIEMKEKGIWIGSLKQTMLKSDDLFHEEDALACLARALKCGEQFYASKHTNNNDDSDAQILLVHGVLGWLAQSKNFQITRHQEFFELSSSLVLYSVSDSVANLVVLILKMLWAESEGLPPDVTATNTQHTSETQTEMPASIAYWTGLLEKYDAHDKANDEDKKAFLVESQQFLCQLLASCLIKLRLNEICFRQICSSIVSQIGMTVSITTVLIMVLKVLLVKNISMHDTKLDDKTSTENKSRKRLTEYLSYDLLFLQFESSADLRDVIKREQEQGFYPLSHGPVDVMVPSQIRLLSALVIADPPTESISILLSSLTVLLRQSMTTDESCFSHFVETVVKAFISLTDSDTTLSPKLANALEANKDKATEQACFQLGDSWRLSLTVELMPDSALGDVDASETLFANLLSSIARAMFQYPASIVPLSLAGAVVGNGQTGLESRMLLSAATSLLTITVEEFDCQRRSKRENNESEAIFKRLAPLLLLRRIPPKFFQDAFQASSRRNHDGETNLKRTLHHLADHLAARLDIVSDPVLDPGAQQFSPQERQLAAEVAGRCLPFNEQLNVQIGASSCFQRICFPSFSDILELMHCDEANDSTQNGNNELAGAVQAKIRRARAALYATCHFIPFVGDCETEVVDEALSSTAFFCLRCLNANQKVFESPGIEKDFLQLQSGCIEFFALCVEEHFSLRSEEPRHLAARSFQVIYSTMVEVLQTGSITRREHKKWLSSSRGRLLGDSVTFGSVATTGPKLESYSTPCCTCLWNSLIVVAQRCSDQNGKTQLLAKTFLPWLVTWGEGTTQNTMIRGPGVPKHHHSLCVTAALQLAFILVTRSKSFGELPPTKPHSPSDPEGRPSIQGLHRWAIVAIQNGKGASDYAGEALRCAGLKVLLAIVTIEQTSDSSASGVNLVFSPKDLKETLSTLQEVASHDPDPKLQALASHILVAAVQ